MTRISTYIGSGNGTSRINITTQLDGSLAEVWAVHVSSVEKSMGVAGVVNETVQEEKHPLREVFAKVMPLDVDTGAIRASLQPQDVAYTYDYAYQRICDAENETRRGEYECARSSVQSAVEYISYYLVFSGYLPSVAAVLSAAITQATKGKGQRHGGDKTPFLEQPWVRLFKTHGLGFLLGQADKKYHEACGKENKEDAEREFLGAIVYLGMALLVLEGKVK